ncbi:MAG: dioxygenase [Bacteroidia bacterium]|nr:dioxygenase [Bacteroidia bacterium]
MPVLFLGHGPIEFAVQENAFTRRWKSLGEQIPNPRAVVIISAHWETQGATQVQGIDPNHTIHDHRPLSPEIDGIQYNPPGAPWLAELIRTTVDRCKVEITDTWGLDQGSWSLLKHMYPAQNVPVVQLSINYTRTLQYHYEMGQSLAFLRNHGVLVIGSGNIVHNLRKSRPQHKVPFKWASQFDLLVKDRVEHHDFNILGDIRKMDDFNKVAVPTMEHYIPLLYVLGMMAEEDEKFWFNEEIIYGALSMRSLMLKPK